MGTLKHQFLKLRVSFQIGVPPKVHDISLSLFFKYPHLGMLHDLGKTTKKYVAKNYWQLPTWMCLKKKLEETVNNMSRTKSWSKKWWFIHGTIRKKCKKDHLDAPKKQIQVKFAPFFSCEI